MKLPYQIDLSDKVVAVTGAGGVLMSEFCRAPAETIRARPATMRR